MVENKLRTKINLITNEAKNSVHLKVVDWLNYNKFKILTECCNQEFITFGSRLVPFDLSGPYIKLKAEKDSMVAVYLKRVVRNVYAVVFEFKIVDLGNETEITLEGYAAGTGLLAKRELPLQNKPGALGSLPRKKGFDLLNKFQEDFSRYMREMGQSSF